MLLIRIRRLLMMLKVRLMRRPGSSMLLDRLEEYGALIILRVKVNMLLVMSRLELQFISFSNWITFKEANFFISVSLRTMRRSEVTVLLLASVSMMRVIGRRPLHLRVGFSWSELLLNLSISLRISSFGSFSALPFFDLTLSQMFIRIVLLDKMLHQGLLNV